MMTKPSLIWPLGRVVKEETIAHFKRELAALLEEEARCADCTAARAYADTLTPPLTCGLHREKRYALTED
jgi:hypothetical protein